ncbi:hypothetical protein ACYSNX_01210 [Myroides sp. LJL115]
MISPSINIAIGKEAKVCIESLAGIFTTRETSLVKLMSFYSIEAKDVTTYKVFNKESMALTPYSLLDKKDESLSENHIFLAQAYNDLISIINVLFKDLQYNFINVNLLYSGIDIDISLVKSLSDIIRQYTQEGTFGTVIIKNYVIISDGTGILSSTQEQQLQKNLSELEQIKIQNIIVDKIFLIDDKNIDSVFLGKKHDYLPFALYEFWINMMTNEYSLTSNLPGYNNFIALGIGMVFFDQIYFDRYFDKRIYKGFLNQQQIINSKKNLLDTTSLDWINPILEQVYKDPKEDLSKIHDFVMQKDHDLSYGSYLHILSLLLGRVPSEIINGDEFTCKYSLKELVYHLVYTYVIEDKKQYTSLDKAKHLLILEASYIQEIEELEESKLDYSQEIEDLNQKLQQTRDSLLQYNKDLERIFNNYKKPLERKQIQIHQTSVLDHEIKELQTLLNSAKSKLNKMNFFSKIFCSGKVKQQIKTLELKIGNIEIEIRNNSKSKASIEQGLKKLYDLYEICLHNYKTVETLSNGMKTTYKRLQSLFDKAPYIDYPFVQNILDDKLLNSYYKENKKHFHQGPNMDLNAVFSYDSQEHAFLIQEIQDHYIMATIKHRENIIDFKMDQYMNSAYDHKKLFTEFDYDIDIKKLQKRSNTFINMIPTYQKQSHELISLYPFKNNNIITKALEPFYSASIPQLINNPNQDRFVCIQIETISSLDNIAKTSKK